jgi:intracellular septation protein A|tara:strand:- start:2 stop:682 length:681 start_codon:yes stop_codon:yes gene_type:complete
MTKSSSSFFNLVCNIIIPTIILTKFSSDSTLGSFYGLLIALSFPIFYGLSELYFNKKINFFSVLGLISVLLTGGIGIFHFSASWLAVKEAFIPGIIGVAVIISTYTKYPLLKLFFEETLNIEGLREKLTPSENEWFNTRFQFSSLLLGGTFFISSFLNFCLATWIVVSDPGTEAFNQELGLMNLLSLPIIALPMMIILMVIMWYLLNETLKKVELTWEEFLTPKDS